MHYTYVDKEFDLNSTIKIPYFRTIKDSRRSIVLFSNYSTWLILNQSEISLFNDIRIKTVGELMDYYGFNQVHSLINKLSIANIFSDPINSPPSWKDMYLILTKNCNLHCPQCFINASQTSDRNIRNEPFRTDGIEQLLRFIAYFADELDGRRIVISGGEPFFYPKDLEQILIFSKKKKLFTEVKSNGTLLQGNLDIINNYIDDIQVSIDAPSPEVHDLIRGTGTYFKIYESVKKILKADKTSVTIAMVPLPQSLNDFRFNLHEFVDKITNINPKKIEVDICNLLYPGRNNQTFFVDGKVPDFDEIMENGTGNKPEQYFLEKYYGKPIRNCGFGEFTILPNGDVFPCVLDTFGRDSHKYFIGNIYRDNFKKISTDMIKLFESTSVDFRDTCCDCTFKYMCGGLCRLKEEKTEGAENCIHYHYYRDSIFSSYPILLDSQTCLAADGNFATLHSHS